MKYTFLISVVLACSAPSPMSVDAAGEEPHDHGDPCMDLGRMLGGLGVRAEAARGDIDDPALRPQWPKTSVPGTPLSQDMLADVQGEILNLQHQGLSQPIETGRRALATACEYGEFPLASTTFDIIDGIDPADLSRVFGSYHRYGSDVVMSGVIEWNNADGGLDALPADFRVPFNGHTFTLGPPAVIGLVTGVVDPGSSFGTQSGAHAHDVVFMQSAVPSFRVARFASAPDVGNGPSSDWILFGNSQLRTLLFELRYRTDGVRNIVWPRVEWWEFNELETGDIAEFAFAGYDSPVNGDDVILFETSAPGVPVDTFTPTTDSGDASFTMPAPGIYGLRHETTGHESTRTLTVI